MYRTSHGKPRAEGGVTYDDAGSGARAARTGTTDRRGAWTVRGTRSRRASICAPPFRLDTTTPSMPG
jgi:hypothetical protein